MIISFFSTGTGGGTAPVDYLTAREVFNVSAFGTDELN